MECMVAHIVDKSGSGQGEKLQAHAIPEEVESKSREPGRNNYYFKSCY
jgi:hypothetical protein